MSKKKKTKVEFRYYRIPEGKYILALLGEKWAQNYGRNVDYLHFHNYMEIGYCYEGRGTMTLREEDYSFRGEQFSVIPKNYLHTTRSEEGNISRWEYLFLDVEGFLGKLYPENYLHREQILQLLSTRAIFCGVEEYPRIAENIRRILEIMRNMEPFYQEEAEGVLLELLAEIARANRAMGKMQEEEISLEERKLGNMILGSMDYISDHISEPIKVSDLADWCHISETHFRRVFSSYMNMSPLAYINLVRIQTACEYLKKTDESVADIAEKCGFLTNSTFNRNFRQIMGVTPVEWRKRPEHYEQQLLKYEVHSEEGW